MSNEPSSLFDLPCDSDALLDELYPTDAPNRALMRPLVQALHTLDLSHESAIKSRLHHQLLTHAQTANQPATTRRKAPRLFSMLGGVALAWVLVALVMLAPTRWGAPAAAPSFGAAVPTATTLYLAQTGVPTDTSLATITPTHAPIATGQIVVPMPTSLRRP